MNMGLYFILLFYVFNLMATSKKENKIHLEKAQCRTRTPVWLDQWVGSFLHRGRSEEKKTSSNQGAILSL